MTYNKLFLDTHLYPILKLQNFSSQRNNATKNKFLQLKRDVVNAITADENGSATGSNELPVTLLKIVAQSKLEPIQLICQRSYWNWLLLKRPELSYLFIVQNEDWTIVRATNLLAWPQVLLMCTVQIIESLLQKQWAKFVNWLKIDLGSGLAQLFLPNSPLLLAKAVVVQLPKIAGWYKRARYDSSPTCIAETWEIQVSSNGRQVDEQVFLLERIHEVIIKGEIFN